MSLKILVQDENRIKDRPISIIAKRPISEAEPLFADPSAQLQETVQTLGSRPVQYGPMNSGLATNPAGQAAVAITGASKGYVKTYLPEIIVGLIVVLAGTWLSRKV